MLSSLMPMATEPCEQQTRRAHSATPRPSPHPRGRWRHAFGTASGGRLALRFCRSIMSSVNL